MHLLIVVHLFVNVFVICFLFVYVLFICLFICYLLFVYLFIRLIGLFQLSTDMSTFLDLRPPVVVVVTPAEPRLSYPGLC